ncbi:MAG: hypothetical protein JWL58_2820, partial [Streptosporangiaceae bacterium]|nr:hypothetical protein [Streptosporangiaceae bacterium]
MLREGAVTRFRGDRPFGVFG